MLRQFAILSTFIVLFSSNAIAQQFNGGIIGGLSTSQIDGDTQKGYKKLGFYSGLYVGRDFSKLFGFKIELLYIGKGAKKTINKIEEFKTSLHYVEMPLLLNIKPVSGFQFNIGLAGAYIANHKLYERGYQIPKDKYDINKFDWGGIITAEYYFSQNLAINVRFEYSLVPMRTVPHRWFNSNFSFGLVYSVVRHKTN